MIRATPFDFPFDGQLSSREIALLIIDLQVGFLAKDGYFVRKGYDPSPIQSILPTVAAVVEAARTAGCLIIWTRQGFRADLADASPYDRWRMERNSDGGLPGYALPRRGDVGFEIVPELDPNPADIIVDKSANGAFYQTDLDVILRARGITHLLFSGCTTDVCVHSTLREASDRKYQCLVIEDACASADTYAHSAAIHMVTVEDGVHGVVATSRDVIAGLRSSTSRKPG